MITVQFNIERVDIDEFSTKHLLSNLFAICSFAHTNGNITLNLFGYALHALMA